VAHIYAALVAISADLAKLGVAKDRQNTQQNFRFRGIDDILNVVSPIFARHDVVMLPRYDDYPDIERTTGKGTTLLFTKVKGTFTFLSAKDGTCVTVTTFGVAMDTGDKATNKAMSAALKYALIQTFLIPTEGEPEQDLGPAVEMVKPVLAPAGFEDWFADMQNCADGGLAVLEAAWKKSKPAYRAYTHKVYEKQWEATKTHALSVDAQNDPTAGGPLTGPDPTASKPGPKRVK
jgi:hypothetical protein